MRQRYRLFRRSSGIFFIEDRATRRQESLRTKDKEVATATGGGQAAARHSATRDSRPSQWPGDVRASAASSESSHPSTDDQVGKRGLEFFDIRSPLVAVPLEFSDHPVGVLVVWSKQNPPPTADHIRKLMPLAKLAAWKIAMWQSESNLKAREESLRTQEEAYRTLVESLDLSIFRKNLNGKFTFVNDAFCRSVHRSREQILDKTDNELYEERLAKEYRADDLAVINTRRPIRNKIEDNQVKGLEAIGKVRVTKIPVFDTSGNVIGIQGVFEECSQDSMRKTKTH